MGARGYRTEPEIHSRDQNVGGGKEAPDHGKSGSKEVNGEPQVQVAFLSSQSARGEPSTVESKSSGTAGESDEATGQQ